MPCKDPGDKACSGLVSEIEKGRREKKEQEVNGKREKDSGRWRVKRNATLPVSWHGPLRHVYPVLAVAISTIAAKHGTPLARSGLQHKRESIFHVQHSITSAEAIALLNAKTQYFGNNGQIVMSPCPLSCHGGRNASLWDISCPRWDVSAVHHSRTPVLGGGELTWVSA